MGERMSSATNGANIEMRELNTLAAIEAAQNLYCLAMKQLDKQQPASSGGRLGDLEVKALAKGMVNYLRTVFAPDLMAKLVQPALDERDSRLAALEQRITVLEQNNADLDTRLAAIEATALSDGGVWKPEKLFEPNQITTYRGAAWVCQKANSDVRPGTSDHWRLLHKTIGGGRG